MLFFPTACDFYGKSFFEVLLNDKEVVALNLLKRQLIRLVWSSGHVWSSQKMTGQLL